MNPRQAAAAAVIVCGALLLPACHSPSKQSEVLDDFEAGFHWEADASEGAVARVHHVESQGASGAGLRLDYDFKGGSGYAVARRPLPMDMPADYRFSLQVRGDGAHNKLEVKLVDASGDNVWWKTYRNFHFDEDWQTLHINQRELRFAWGPSKDKILRDVAHIEFVVVAEEGRGSGSVYFDNLGFKAKEPQPLEWESPTVEASSFIAANYGPGMAVDGDPETVWRSEQGGAQTLTLDFGRSREFGALALQWEEGAVADEFDIAYSDDSSNWQVRQTVAGQAGQQRLYLSGSEARYVQLRLRGPEAAHFALREIEVKDAVYGDSLTAFIEGLARDSQRGSYPRALSGEQSYWTVVGTDGGADNGLISEDGAVEVGRGLFSVEPFVVADGVVSTWADVDINHSLEDGYLPIPTVHWQHEDWWLDVTSLAAGDAANSRLLTRYTLGNRTNRVQELELAVAARPYQVNSPKQVLNTPGGVSPIKHVQHDGAVLEIDGSHRIYSLTSPDGVLLSSVSSGAVPELLRAERHSAGIEISDPTSLAAGTFRYLLTLQPGESASVVVASPLSGDADLVVSGNAAAQVDAWFDAQLAETRNGWRERLNAVEIRVPESGQRIVDTLRSSLAHILISRKGINLRPGTRNYGHSWIRDGAMISEGLLRMGVTDIPRAYVQWFAPFQFDNGKVPCCVTQHNTADPIPENDSHGQLIFLIAEIYRYTGDAELVHSLWPHVQGAIDYMDQMRLNERSDENLQEDRKALYGLLEPSISHEGYPQPAYSYWDNFWGMKGYNDAVELAEALGYDDDAGELRQSRDAFRNDLFNSIRTSAGQHGIDYIGGAAELGDFDATSTTIALAPGGEQDNLPQDLLFGTFERYWREFTARRDGDEGWSVYTPYEVRSVATFVRLGWRDRAHELLDFFFADRRPEPWNQWAEVVGRDPREARFIGDMPHAWISSDYIRSALDLFVFSRARDESLVLAAGIPADWINADGVAIRNVRTPYGELRYSLRAEGSELHLDVRLAGERFPPGGLIFPWPFDPDTAMSATLNGEDATFLDGEFRIDDRLAELRVKFSP